MSQVDFSEYTIMSPEPAGQVCETIEHPRTGGKSISALASNGIFLDDDDDEDEDSLVESIEVDEHPAMGGKSLSSYATKKPFLSGKSLPTAEAPSVTRYGDDTNDISDSTIVDFLAQNPERLAAVLDEEPAILENFLSAEPAALSNYLQANPSFLRNFFEANPECLWAYFATCPEKLGQFCDAHPTFMTEWLTHRQFTVQNYLNNNPALFWNHVQAHPSFQTGGRVPIGNSFTAGLCFEIPEDQLSLIRNPVLWSLPKDEQRSQEVLQHLCKAGHDVVAVQGSAEGEVFEDDDYFDDAENLEQLIAEDEACCGVDNQTFVAGELDHNKSDTTLPEFVYDEDLNNSTVLPSIEQDDMFGVYPSDSEASDDETTVRMASHDVAVESENEDDEYVNGDVSDEESEQDIVTPHRRPLSAMKGLLSAGPAMKTVRTSLGGKSVPAHVADDDSDVEEDMSEEEDTIESAEEDSDDSDEDDTIPARALVPYPAPRAQLDASRRKKAGKKWRLFEEDIVIGHMLDVRDEGIVVGEERFRETCRRMEDVNHIVRSWGAVKNFWNRTGRARSGFDERKNKRAPLATSQQGKNLQKATSKSSSKPTTPTKSTTPSKTASKKAAMPSPSVTPKSTSKKVTKSGTSKTETSKAQSFSLQDVQKMQAEFQAKMQAEFQVKMQTELQTTLRAEVQQMMKGLAHAASGTPQPEQVKTSDLPSSNKKRSRDAEDDLEDGQVSEASSPKKSRLSARPAEAPSRHRIPERREDREHRPRTAMQKIFSSRRDSPVQGRYEQDYREDEPVHRSRDARGARDSHYPHRDDRRDYGRQQTNYYRHNNSDRYYDDRRRSDYRY